MAELMQVTPGSPEWLAARRAGVTATDIVTILGLSSHDSIYSLFWRKLGQVPDTADNDRFALGRYLESYVVNRWMSENGRGAAPGGLYRHEDRAWQLATPDRVFYDDHPYKPKVSAPLECKSWTDADRASWESGPPPAVRAQLLWQMDTLDAPVGYWAVVFLPSGRFEYGAIEHTDACCKGFIPASGCPVCVDQDLMRKAGEEFYRRLTFELPPPDPDSSAATLAALRARFAPLPKEAEISFGLYSQWDEYKELIDEYKAKVRELEIEMRVQAADAGVLTVNGRVIARRVVSDAQVKAHTRHMDYYRRVKAKADDSE